MKLAHNAYVAIADGEKFSLCRNEGALFKPRLVELATPQLDRTNFSAGVRDGDQIGQQLGRTQLDELAHAAAIAEWLNAKAISGDIEQIVVIADPKTLGEMRRHYHERLRKALAGEIAKTATGVPLANVEKIIVEA